LFGIAGKRAGATAIRAGATAMADLLSFARVPCEIVAAIYTADLFSGLGHLVGDMATIVSKPLREHVETTMPAVKEFMETDPKFIEASAMDKMLFNFQIHHIVPHPASKSDAELFIETATGAGLAFLVSAAATWYGYLPMWFARVWLLAIMFVTLVQNVHISAHKRNHGC